MTPKPNNPQSRQEKLIQQILFDHWADAGKHDASLQESCRGCLKQFSDLCQAEHQRGKREVLEELLEEMGGHTSDSVFVSKKLTTLKETNDV